jgi:hypothetical protein
MEVELIRKRMFQAKMLGILCENCEETEEETCEFGIKLVNQVNTQCNTCTGCTSMVCSMGEIIKYENLEDQLTYCYAKRGNDFPFILRPETPKFFIF